MTTFPDLTPAAAPISPGTWPASAHQALDGGRSIIRHGSAEIGRRLQLSFVALTEQEFLWIRNHYRGHRSAFDSFDFSATTLAAGQTPTGYAWRWATPPQVIDRHADVFDVSCEFIAAPRRLVRVPGATWQSARSTLTPGAWTGIIPQFQLGAAWVTSSTTLTRGAWTVVEQDPHYSSVSLLLHFEGANNSTTFTDSGPLGLSVTRNASSGVISTAQAAIGSSSFSVGTDQLNLPSNSALTLDGDFTIEWRARHTSLSGKQQYFCNFAGTNIQIAYSSGLFFFPPDVSRTLSLSVDTWAALWVSRLGSTLYWGKDGTLLGTATDTTTYNLSGGNIARGGSENMQGFLDEIRITKGVCRYTASYTVRTTAFPDS